MSYFDLQVNGYGGVDFNQDDLSAEKLRFACERLRLDGVEGILATIITEDPETMMKRLQRLVALRNEDPLIRETIYGLHIEGPFLHPGDGYRGAHPADSICLADVDICQRLLDAGEGLVRIFTFAPEQDPGFRVTRLLADQGIVASAGHSDASLDQLKGAIDAGLTMVTHLGNGCPQKFERHDNFVQRVLSLRAHLWLCFIADGVHIPFHALRNYLDLALPHGRCLVTTDAMAAAGLGSGRYQLGRWEVEVGDDLAARAPGNAHLLGSAISMSRAASNLVEHLGLELTTVDLMTNQSPRIASGCPVMKVRSELPT